MRGKRGYRVGVLGLISAVSMMASVALGNEKTPSPVQGARAGMVKTVEPRVLETRTVDLTQTVSLNDIPAGAKSVRLWVPIPSDAAWQRVLDCQVVSAPAGWRIVTQEEGRGDFVYVEVKDPKDTRAEVVVRCVVERKGVSFPLETAELPTAALHSALQPVLFSAELDRRSPLMEVTGQIQAIADRACGKERDPAKQAVLLMQAVAEMADHYSKDPSKPTCGRGSAEDCIQHEGGCCTDLHSLFIALARSRNLPARMQYGYRLLDAKAGQSFEPGYRCWVEYFVPGAGWVPTDIVAADNADAAHPMRWGSLSATRVWVWEGRSFELTPKAQAGRVNTMLFGWAEVDGKAVDVLPAADGSPSKLRRTVRFDVVKADRDPATPRLPE